MSTHPSSNQFLDAAIQISVGSLSPTINWRDLAELEFNLPPIEEQAKLAELLWAFEATKEAYKRLLALTDELVKAQFVEMFGDPVTNPMGWPIRSLGEIFTIIDGDRGKQYPHGSDFLDDGYCLFLNAGNVTLVGFDFQNVQFISIEKDEQLRTGRMERDDIVLTTRGTIGNVAIYDSSIEYNVMRINSGMVLLRDYDSYLVSHYFIQMVRRFSIISKHLSGSAQPQLPITIMRKIMLPLPPHNLQRGFADIATSADQSKLAIQQSLTALEQARNALMEKVFG